MADTSFFLIGCMKRQHAVILESSWERDSIITRFPASRTGILTPLLTCFTLLFFSLLLGQIILSPTPILPSAFGRKISNSKFLFFLPFGQKFSKSNFNSSKYSKTIPNSVLVAKSFQFYKNILRQFQVLS